MIKQFTLSAAALMCFASQGYARHPFVSDPISNAPSVLVHTDAPRVAQAPAVEVGADAAQAQADSAAIGAEAAASVDASADVSNPAPAMASNPAPVYRYACPPRRQNNSFFGELMELERKKNAWLRRTFFGR